MTSVPVYSSVTFDFIMETVRRKHDATTDSWFLMKPILIYPLLVSYLIFAIYLGPKLMRNRPPMNLKYVMIAYNVMQVAINVYLVQVIIRHAVMPGLLNVFCEGNNGGIRRKIDIARHATYIFFLSRIFDFCDTIFIVLKKKNNQLSFLHIYHHFLMGFFSWIGVYVGAGIHALLFGLLNCSVHAVMYFYYLLMLVSPKYRKSIWWKKHITHMQLLQFTILLVQHTGTLMNHSCPRYQRVASIVVIPQILLIAILFANFYYKTYIKAKPSIEPNKNK